MTKPGLYLIGGATDDMLSKMNAAFEVFVQNELDDPTDFLQKNGDKIEAVATNGHDGVPNEVFENCKNLKVASCYGVGYDGIDTAKARENGVIVTHTPNVLNADVANLAILLLLATSRNLIQEDQYVRAGHWESKGNSPLTDSIEGKKIGIVGLGRIGEAIAHKLGAFDARVAYHSRNKRSDVSFEYYGDLVEMAKDCFAIIAITPGGPATYKIINEEVMNAIGPAGILINVARGSVVDETALINALKEGRLGKAGLDVFEAEPRVPEELRKLDNVVLTPHVASATYETRKAMGDLTVENLTQYFQDGTVISPVPECADMV